MSTVRLRHSISQYDTLNMTYRTSKQFYPLKKGLIVRLKSVGRWLIIENGNTIYWLWTVDNTAAYTKAYEKKSIIFNPRNPQLKTFVFLFF